jgi:hypothetical protein
MIHRKKIDIMAIMTYGTHKVKRRGYTADKCRG